MKNYFQAVSRYKGVFLSLALMSALTACYPLVRQTEAEEKFDHGIETLSYPGKLVTSMLGKRLDDEAVKTDLATDWRASIIDACAKLPGCGKDQPRGEIEKNFECVMHGNHQPDVSLKNRDMRIKLVEMAIAKAVQENSALASVDRHRVAQLLVSGDFSDEIAATVGVAFNKLNPQTKKNKVANYVVNVVNKYGIPFDRLQDIFPSEEEYRSTKQCLDYRKYFDGPFWEHCEKRPNVFLTLIRNVYKIQISKNVSDTMSAVAAADNDALRLALIAYANSVGIKVTNNDISVFRAGLNTDDYDLRPAMAVGADILKAQFGIDQATRKLAYLGREELPSCQ
ncbi:MAG: hypothetical protein EPN21_10095 [Methylococcaceae bacterium]|nr:MAG: hypothetical protein EPN21_10095 [Methylococcaceae bacterium]